MGLERRGRAGQVAVTPTQVGEERRGGSRPSGKSFEIDKHLIAGAWGRVRGNRGAPGVDAVSIDVFGSDVRNNLYKLWNRMSSGSYLPGPVRAVEIPKDAGAGVRVLGVPNVADRVAQTAAAMVLERLVEPIFHRDSYGYRPGRGALDAVAVTRKRCWRRAWVVDLDIQAFFDSVPHDLILKAVAAHTRERWVLLYVRRWLRAPMRMPDGTLVAREKGTPQGSPISPLLANLFMHYAFDMWMDREFPDSPFERYADDVVVHCDTKAKAEQVRDAVAERLAGLGLRLHPAKTKVVYCQDGNRAEDEAEHVGFDFLGYTFRARRAKGPKGYFVGFLPAISDKARKAVGKTIRNWRLQRWDGSKLAAIAAYINPVVRGWVNYYGAFYRSKLAFLSWRINQNLIRWAMRQHKRLRGKPKRAWDWLQAIKDREPALFVHWQLTPIPTR
ncbi:MAG: group II intron reverse transcriptase/maturase [Candidatus Nanopelagicales bacterium]|nr:group II intron reverse transcriptase/maturase [Candidatus Nanopelagicales bacterium]